MQKSGSILENEAYKSLGGGGFEMQTDYLIPTRRSDLEIGNKTIPESVDTSIRHLEDYIKKEQRKTYYCI